MASTKATTPTKPLAFGFGALSVMLGLFAAVNLFASFTPAADLGNLIDSQLKIAVLLPQDQKQAVLSSLKPEQEAALLARPSDPYGWARLSALRSATGDDPTKAFIALKQSDQVSPYEADQLPQRALDWRRFHDTETKDQQEYQDALWQRAFMLANQATWDAALHEKIVNEVKDALMRKDPDLALSWKGKMSDAGMKY